MRDAAAKWHSLGLALDVKSSVLDNIDADYHGVRDKLDAVLDYWSKDNAGEYSWKFLCKALRSKLVERPDLAKAIEKE